MILWKMVPFGFLDCQICAQCELQVKMFYSIVFKSSRVCGEVGLIIRLHLLFGEVRSVTTALKVVEEVQQGLQGIERELEEEEVGWNGELKVEEQSSLHAWMTWETHTTWAFEPRCGVQIMTTRTWLLDYAHMESRVHQFTCWGSCALCGRCSGSWWSRCHWCRASCRSVSPRTRNTKSFFPSGHCSPIVHL